MTDDDIPIGSDKLPVDEDIIPRNPDVLTKTKHYGQEARRRNIGWHETKQSIKIGSIENARGKNNIRFRLDFPGPDTQDLLVVVDPIDMTIVTAFWEGDGGEIKL